MSRRKYRSDAERNLWWALVDRCSESGSCQYNYVGIVEHNDSRRFRVVGYVVAVLLCASALCGVGLHWW